MFAYRIVFDVPQKHHASPLETLDACFRQVTVFTRQLGDVGVDGVCGCGLDLFVELAAPLRGVLDELQDDLVHHASIPAPLGLLGSDGACGCGWLTVIWLLLGVTCVALHIAAITIRVDRCCWLTTVDHAQGGGSAPHHHVAGQVLKVGKTHLLRPVMVVPPLLDLALFCMRPYIFL